MDKSLISIEASVLKMREVKNSFIALIGTVALLLAGIVAYAQTDTAYTVMNGTHCNGQNPDGAWLTDETWESSNGLKLPPEEDWPGSKIIIRNNIIICNNNDIDLSQSNVDTVIMRSGSSINYRANSTLILPEGAVLIMEENTSISVTNQSQGTLLQIGNDSIWGKEILCTIQIDGPRVIGNQTRICEEEILLPVELLSFNADTVGSSVMLTWITLSETNTDYFEIQHSMDAIHWTALDQVPASGFSKQAQFYYWNHDNPAKAINYYRIKQVDFDGQFSFFPVVNAQLTSNLSCKINNPIDDKLYLTVQSYNKKDIGIAVTAMILSPNGAINVRERLIINEGENNFELNVGHLKSGMYFVKILSGAEQILSEKVIKW